ncbi:MAG: ParB/RepB/Spo0J family partition protein [Sphingomonas pseudosanguinis]|uniref:ParB/RepB/Spo0J family partition protein n=1 Tax=Sphingomonas pseudosanguinis TaxID=413712 RepID=UPI00391A1CB9
MAAPLHEESLVGFILIRTDEIDAVDRLRPIDTVWAEALGQVMAREGQDTPIQVCRLPGKNRWTLVVGAHRLEGAKTAGIEYLKAEVVSADRDDRRLREVRENLWRSDLTPVDRAAFIAEAVAIHKRRVGIDPTVDGRVGSIAARWQKAVKDEAVDTTATMAVVYGFTDQVASDLGLSPRTVERDLMLYRRLPPSVVERLRAARHPVLKNATQLRALAKLEGADQVKALNALVGDAGEEPCKTVADAIKRTKPPREAPRPEQKRFNTVLDTISRMSAAERLALFQSPQFQDVIPAEAQRLLAPMRRGPMKDAA